MSSYLDGLNPQQKEAVINTDGPLMILAGAGSGKTKTIISRIVYLIDKKKLKPWEILAVTFSNRAAKEIRERIHKQKPDIKESELNLTTFHSFCSKVLRYNGHLVGLKSNFSIYDTSESMAVVKELQKRNEIDPKKDPAQNILDLFDKIKNEGYYVGSKESLKKELKEHEYFYLFKEYEDELLKNNAVDFGGLITTVIKILEQNPDVLAKYGKKYKYVLVDEYQDTNKAQFKIIKLFGTIHQNITVVGDGDQCLIEGTLISTDRGEFPIEEIKVGDFVLASTGKYALASVPVSAVNKTFVSRNLIKITTDEGKVLISTKEHLHFAEDEYKSFDKDLVEINLLGGARQNSRIHKIKVLGEEKFSDDVGALYSSYQELSKNKSFQLKETISLTADPIEMVFGFDLKVGMNIINKEFEYETIVKIEEIEYEGYVYDLDIPIFHNYIANEIFTHNSIYSWRGAEIRNILDFEKAFPAAKILKLEENYRSSGNIIEAAVSLIKNNVLRKEKIMFTSNEIGEKIKLIDAYSGDAEGEFVADQIKKLMKNKVSPKEIAVFYRNNAQSRIIEDNFRKLKIPHQVIGGLKFYERKEIKDIIAYLQVIVNPSDEMSLLRVINTPSRGIGDKALQQIKEDSFNQEQRILEYLSNYQGTKKSQEGVLNFLDIIKTGSHMNKKKENLVDILDMILKKSGYLEILKKSTKYEDQARLENIKELKSSITHFVLNSEDKSLDAYLEAITLDRSEDNMIDGKVSLMTVHASKGLEFDYVFLVGAEENIFPSAQSIQRTIKELEEERRLFYVAITRARKQINILYARQRFVFGQVVFNEKSRFILELPSLNVEKIKI